MKLDENINNRLRKRGGKKEWISRHIRLAPDNIEALDDICHKERWYIENVLDWLVEGFIQDYRQLWPVNGMMQTQLPAFAPNSKKEKETEGKPKEEKPKKTKRETSELKEARDIWHGARTKLKQGEDVSNEIEQLENLYKIVEKKEDEDAMLNIGIWVNIARKRK